MPSPFSQEFIARIREPPPQPFANWQPWQRILFAYGACLFWLILTGGTAAGLFAIWHLPVCDSPHAALLNYKCHTPVGIALCIGVLLALHFVYVKYLELLGRIANNKI